jgi:hypothetical protein
LRQSVLDDTFVDRIRDVVVEEALNYSQELCKTEDESLKEEKRNSMKSSLRHALSVYETTSQPKRVSVLDWDKLKEGVHFGVNNMDYWKSIACDQSNEMDILLQKMLVTVATSLLGVSASESVDESDFSGAGLMLAKQRSMVIQAFIKRSGWSLRKLLEEHESLLAKEREVLEEESSSSHHA